ncbi:MAG TPA: hypothetical protein VGH82_14470 [Gaiellaceae bacterium]|jgi:hypothetical protein
MPNGRNWFLRWFDADWYRYLRTRYPERLLFLLPVLLGLVAWAGYAAVNAMGSSPQAAESYVRLDTTVIRTVKVREHGKVVIKRIPEIKHIYAKPVTVLQTHTVKTPGGVKVVTEPVVRYKPVYRRKVVLVHGKPVTVNQIVTNTRMLTDTQLLTVTNEHTSTVVNDHTSTVVNNQTVNQTQTLTKTQTAPVVTVTLPPDTVTEHETVTQPPDTVTVTTPGDTVTVTITDTSTGP